MKSPIAVVVAGKLLRVVSGPAPFTYGSGDMAIQHPAVAWEVWSAADWAARCPDWTLLPLVDQMPVDTPTLHYERRPEADWSVAVDAVTVTYRGIPRAPEEISAATQAALAQRVAAVKVEAATRILAIAPEWAQRNLTARAADLALLYPGTKGIDLPEPERSEYLAGQAVWSRIQAIRDASNSIEAALAAAAAAEGASEADVMAVDITSMWPE